MDLIDFCYGVNANIYKILKIGQDASQKDIQSAFMSRRLELYQSIQKINIDSELEVEDKDGKIVTLSEREFVEKKMDALVAAFRILRDPSKRRKYDVELTVKRNLVKAAQRIAPRSSPRSLVDFQDTSRELKSSLTADLDDLDLSDSDDKENEVKPKLTPKRGLKKMRRLKKGSDSSVAMSVNSRVSSTSNSDLSAATPTPTPTKSALKPPAVDVSKIRPPMHNSSPDKLMNPSIVKKKKKKLKGRTKSATGHDPVEKYYKDVVTRRETSLGSWLRRNEYENQANSVDEFVTEVAGSAADIWLSFSQVVQAFTVEEDAIDAMTEDIENNKAKLTAGNY